MSLSPANEWNGVLHCGDENLHCAYTLQCVHATVSIRSPNNTMLKRMMSSIMVALHLFIRPSEFG